jgi:hypothetical protein
MLGHMSLLFIPREKSEVHPQLCAKVLNIIRNLIRKSILFPENYSFLIKILLMCFESLLAQGNESLSVIRGDISRVLFETFIRSEVRDAELWTEMLKKFSSWITNTEVNLSWASVAVGLTSRVVNILYGEGSETLELEFRDEGVISIHISTEHTILNWNYFVVNVLENTLKEMFDPQTHKEFVRSVSKIVDVFITLSKNRCEIDQFDLPKQLKSSAGIKRLTETCRESHLNYQQGNGKFPIPNVKDLIDIFGEWLFVQSRMNSGGTVYGHAEAVGTICRVFNYLARPVPDIYLAKFYSTLSKHFKYSNESNFQVAGSILNHSIKLLTQEYRGVRLLLHKSCIFRVLDNYIKSKDISQQIKRDCYSIISAIVPSMKPYKKQGVINILNDCLCHAISAENELESLVTLFWSATGYLLILDDLAVLEGLLKALLKKIISLVTVIDKQKFLDFLKVVGTLPFMVFAENLISTNLVKEIVMKLILPTLGKNVKGSTDSTHFYCLNLLIHWAMKFPGFLKDSATRYQIFETFAILKTLEREKEYTTIIEANIFNYAGKRCKEIQLPYGNSCSFTPATWPNDVSQPLKHFLFKYDTLVSTYNTENAVILIVRNRIGKFFWKFRHVVGKSASQKDLQAKIGLVQKPRVFHKVNSEPSKVAELIKDLNIVEVLAFEKLSRLFKSCSKNLQNFIHKEHVPVKRTKKESPSKTCQLRPLFASFGFLESDLIGELSGLSSPVTEELIKELDMLSNRELYVVPLLYLSTPEASEQDLVEKKTGYPKEFCRFVNSCGLHLTRESFRVGCSGSVEDLVGKYGGVVYNREYHFELALMSPALFNTSHEVVLNDLLSMSSVVILWNQRSVQVDSLKSPIVLRKPKFVSKIVILLTPLRNGIVRVNLQKPELMTETSFGPLLDNMIVPIPMLGKYLSMTIATIGSGKTSKVATTLEKSSIFKRLKELANDSEKPFKSKVSASLSYLFKSN